jgi:hypothetical protein
MSTPDLHPPGSGRGPEAAAHHDEHHHHPKRIEKFEGFADYLTIAIVVILGVALVVGFFTATGDAPWMN